ncbi:MAG: hypothetical protein ACREE4_09830 [Stellaceae bacterium]
MKRSRQPEADPIRKARFREAARAIVAKDRDDRKHGFAVDTAGAIARAMERAYRQGFADAQSETPAPPGSGADAAEALEWALIPPRPRTAFWDICLSALGRGDTPEDAAHLVPATTERGTPGWQQVQPDQPSPDKPIGEKTIRPLLRLGLLEIAGGRPSVCESRPAAKRPGGAFYSAAGSFRRI